mmetsp:Transcript_59868/g.129096  ORF Transcript_59868/g.129096 Transcript_59868/m.129096 type:complete len:423 (+) Transcript_59868:35-1303(+)
MYTQGPPPQQQAQKGASWSPGKAGGGGWAPPSGKPDYGAGAPPPAQYGKGGWGAPPPQKGGGSWPGGPQPDYNQGAWPAGGEYGAAYDKGGAQKGDPGKGGFKGDPYKGPDPYAGSYKGGDAHAFKGAYDNAKGPYDAKGLGKGDPYQAADPYKGWPASQWQGGGMPAQGAELTLDVVMSPRVEPRMLESAQGGVFAVRVEDITFQVSCTSTRNDLITWLPGSSEWITLRFPKFAEVNVDVAAKIPSKPIEDTIQWPPLRLAEISRSAYVQGQLSMNEPYGTATITDSMVHKDQYTGHEVSREAVGNTHFHYKLAMHGTLRTEEVEDRFVVTTTDLQFALRGEFEFAQGAGAAPGPAFPQQQPPQPQQQQQLQQPPPQNWDAQRGYGGGPPPAPGQRYGQGPPQYEGSYGPPQGGAYPPGYY